MSSLQLAFLNLTRRLIPNLIALLSISTSVACAGVLLRLYTLSGARFSSLARAGDAIVGAKAGGLDILLGSLNLEGEYPDFIPMKLYESLHSKREVHFEDGANSQPVFVKQTIPIVFVGKYRNFRVIGTDEEFFKRALAADSPGFAQGQWNDDSASIVLGAEIAKRYSLDLSQEIEVNAWNKSTAAGKAYRLRIAGILEPQKSVWDRALFTSLKVARQILAESSLSESQTIWGPDVLHYFFIYLEPGGLLPLENLINRRTVAQVINVPEQMKKLAELTGTGRDLGLFMTLLILLLGGLAVTTMMITRFDAMLVQLAILRAIGYKKKAIALWLIWEGVILGVCACLIGSLLDALIFPWLRLQLGTALPASELIDSSIFQSAPVWGAAILATVIAACVPLIRLYNQNVHESLRGN